MQLNRIKYISKFVWELFAKDGNRDTDSAQQRLRKCSSNADSINQVVQTVTENNHPCNRSNDRVTLFIFNVMIMDTDGVGLKNDILNARKKAIYLAMDALLRVTVLCHHRWSITVVVF